MIIGISLLAVAVLCVILGTKDQAAVMLYFDAQDVLEDGTLANRADQEERITVSVGGQPVSVEADGGLDVAEDLRSAAQAEDPVNIDEAASNLFEELRRNGL